MTNNTTPNQPPTFAILTGTILTSRILMSDFNQFGEALIRFAALSLGRHKAGDWGDLDSQDAAANDHAAILGERVLSAYALPDDLAARVSQTKLWIITEANRASTTVLWPEEY